MKKLYSIIFTLILLTSLISVYASDPDPFSWPPERRFEIVQQPGPEGAAVFFLYVAENPGANKGIVDVSITENDNQVKYKNCNGEIRCTLFYTAIHTDGQTYTYKAYVTSMETGKTYLVKTFPDWHSQHTLTFPLPHGVSLSDPADQSVFKDIQAEYIITLTNIGENTDSYTLTLDNINNAELAELDIYTTPNLTPGSSVDLTLRVEDLDPANYEVIINTVSQADSIRTASTSITTTVLPIYGDLTGNVKDSINNIYNAIVHILQDSTIINSLDTDSPPYGEYSFLNLLTGTYTLEAFKSGFEDYSQPVTITASPNTKDIILTPASFSGIISGTILNGNPPGTLPIPNAEILIIKSDNLEEVQIVYSDSNGDYIINGLPPTLGTFTYSLDAIEAGYTQSFGPSGISLNSGQTLTSQDIYLL